MLKKALFWMNGGLIILFSLIIATAGAQTPGNLILIDAETKQPFTVRIGDQLFASTSHGHLTITHLKDSNYKLAIRFQKLSTGEQVFPVKVKEKDLGFQIRNTESNWVLYNWQTKETIKPLREIDSTRILEQGVKREDGFSSLMAAVVNDTSVMYNTYSGESFGGVDSVKSPVANKTVIPDSLQPVKNMPRPIPVAKAKAVKTGVKKIREVSLKISRKMVFTDVLQDGTVDTVTLFVYFENPKTDSSNKSIAESNQTTTTTAVVTESAQSVKTPITEEKAGNTRTCQQIANDTDMASLREAILEANSDQEKIAVASGAFALKCFTVAQIRILGGLFTSEKVRYKLMDAAHLHIADHDQFRELVDMFGEKGMQKKFLLLAEKQS